VENSSPESDWFSFDVSFTKEVANTDTIGCNLLFDEDNLEKLGTDPSCDW